MTAPVASTRLTPAGKKLTNGKGVLITFTADRDIELFEQEVAAPGIKADDAIETTTMQNVIWRTFHPGDLLTLEEFDITCGYDPVVFVSLIAIMRAATTVTIHFPDLSTLAFYGYVAHTKPSAMKRGERPTMVVTVRPTNADPTTCLEEAPAYSAGPGTGC